MPTREHKDGALRILLLVKRFPRMRDDSWLTDELAEALAERGARVDVLLFDAAGEWPRGETRYSERITVFSYPLGKNREAASLNLMRFLGWTRALIGARRLVARRSYDAVINFSVASVFAGVCRLARKRMPDLKVILVLWDFFPLHQQEIGKLNNRLLIRLLYRLENREVLSAHYVGLMSPANRKFFERYHPNFRGNAFILPVWGRSGDDDASRATKPAHRDDDTLTLVFGGQLARGRGLDRVIELKRRFSRDLGFLHIEIFGSGELLNEMRDSLDRKKIAGINLRGRVTRKSYMEKLADADAGLIVTVPGVSVPTFPSKVIDYMRAGVPVLAWVEDCTDFGVFVEDTARCGYYVDIEDQVEMLAALKRLLDDKRAGHLHELGENGRRYFREHLEVGEVATKLLADTDLLQP